MAIDLLLLSNQSLLTNKGKSLLDDSVSEKDVLSKIAEYKKRYPNLDLSNVTDSVAEDLTNISLDKSNTENSTREQRRQNRQKRREDRREERQERQETREERLNDRLRAAGVENPEAERTRIGAEIAILLAKLRSNRPTPTIFTVTGRLTETVGGDPVKGAEIMLGVNPNPLGAVVPNSSITGGAPMLTPGDFEVIGNITYESFIDLELTTRQQIVDNVNTYRLNQSTEDNNGKSSTNTPLTLKQFTEYLEESEKYKQLEGVTVEINPNNLLYIPNREFKNPNYDDNKGESSTNLKQITGNINNPNKPVVTDETGQFKIKIIVPIIPSTQKCPIDIAILSKGGKQKSPSGGYIEKNFMQGTFFLLNGDRTVKTELGIKKVLSMDDAAKILSQNLKTKIDNAQNTINNIALNQVEWVLSQRKIALNKITNVIKSKLIPLAISLLLLFGITKISEMNRKTCPSPAELDNILRRRNRITRQLNSIYKTIATNLAISGVFLILSKQLKGVRLNLDALPFPQATGTPPAKDFGGLIFSQPYSTTAKIQRLNELLEELSKTNKDLNKAILTNLVFVIAGVISVLLLLKAIDKLLQECSEENGVTQLELTAINQELLDLGEEQADDGNPVINNINGFDLSVETDNKNPVGTLNRRFAVAKNAQGVTLLKGEPSFSSNDQILIDELVFYIQQNDLKAY